MPVAVTPQVTLKVRDELTPKLGIGTPASKEFREIGAVGHTAAPDPTAHVTTGAQFRPALGESLRIAFVTGPGPKLETVIVYVMVEPAATKAGAVMPLVFVMAKLAAGWTVAVDVEMVADGVVTVSNALTVPLTTLVNVPVNVDDNRAVIVYLTCPPIDKDTVLLTLPVPLGVEHAVVTTVVVKPGFVGAQTQLTLVNEEGSASVIETLPATAGPALLTTME